MYNNDTIHASGVIKDSLVIASLFILLCFIDLSLAAFVSAVTTVVLLNRRIRLYTNPVFCKELIRDGDKELKLPDGTDLFDLSYVPSIDYLYKYTEVICSMLVSPRVLIIRLRVVSTLTSFEEETLFKVISELHKNKIIVLLSDVTSAVQKQLVVSGVEEITGKGNIFLNINEAVLKAGNPIIKRV